MAVIKKSRHGYMKKNMVSHKIKLDMFEDHKELTNRIQKKFYYGKYPKIDRPSLSLTSLSVDLLKRTIPNDHLGSIDMHYAAHVGRDACISPCSMMLAMVYIERLRLKDPEYIQSTSSSELFLISMMIATKFLNDDGIQDEVFNEEWALSGNMDIKDFNALERNFLAAIDWNIFVSPQKFVDVLNHFEMWIAVLEGKKRGWFSYSDIDTLTNKIFFSENWKIMKERIFKVIAICSVAYTAAACILLCSTSLALTGLSSNVQVQNQTYQPTAKKLDIPSSLDRTKTANAISNCYEPDYEYVLNIETREFWNKTTDSHISNDLFEFEENSDIVNRTNIKKESIAILADKESKITTKPIQFPDQTWNNGLFTQKIAICA